MEIIYLKGFKKSYNKLSKEDRNTVDEVLGIFQKNPFAPELKNHSLKGDKVGFRSISAGFDLRILYREEGGHAIVFLIKTGTHNQVY